MGIETLYDELGFGGFQIEDMVHVTDTGIESRMTRPGTDAAQRPFSSPACGFVHRWCRFTRLSEKKQAAAQRAQAQPAIKSRANSGLVRVMLSTAA